MINTTQLSDITIDQDQVIIRALSSITSEQADAIGIILHSNRLAWNTQIVDDYDGYRSVFIEPTISGDKQKTFFISGTYQCLELFEAQYDDLTLISTFTNVQAIGAYLVALLGMH